MSETKLKGKTEEKSSSPPPESSSRKKRKRSKKNNLDDGGQDNRSSNPTTHHHKSKPKKSKSILNGITVSVSTLEVKGESHSDADASFRAVSDLCVSLGASVSSQVCKRVNLLICTPSAVENATQRVRKAYKKRIPLVDMQWLHQCQRERQKVEIDDFRLDDKAKAAIESRASRLEEDASQLETKQNTTKNDDKSEVGEEPLPDAGWSEPVSLGCCCVCHENGSEADCKWCTDECIVK